MKSKRQRKFVTAIALLAGFALWTVLVCRVDVQPIGPEGTEVGFAAINGFAHRLTGVHMALYTLTDWLGLVPIAFMSGFTVLGLVQWIGRKRIRYVDHDILLLGGFYIAVMGVYLLFEEVTVNYRPVLIDGFLEVSYPSSTTLLVMCVMPTAILLLRDRIKNRRIKQWVSAGLSLFTVFMVVGRLLAGVHWLSDIVGGLLLSGGLVMLYCWAVSRNHS